MTQQIPVDYDARADEIDRGDGTREIAYDLAYRRMVMVNIMFYGPPAAGDRGWVLIDTGVFGSRATIEQLAEHRFGKGARPAAIILTHGHFDHVGALEELAEKWDAPVFAHPLELPYLTGKAAYPPGDPTVGGGLVAGLSALYSTRPVNVSRNIAALPENGTVPFMDGWRWLHTPGHSPGHVSFWRESDRTLIVGDAFVTTAAESVYATAVQEPELHGPPRYFTIDWQSAELSVRALAALEPDLVISGHGRALAGPEMRQALHRLADNFADVAVPERGHYLAAPARAADGSAYRPAQD
jgi:glyoxylase-like metal-dependent hydrolase (beta-lactamase superfamily II)